MTWQEMSEEIVLDAAQVISGLHGKVEYIVGIVRWGGKMVAGRVYEPNTLLSGIGAEAMSVLPEPTTAPPGHWRPVEVGLVPTKNGSSTVEDLPIAYFVMLAADGGVGLVSPSRYGGGKVMWSANSGAIEYVAWALVKAGTVRAHRRATDESNGE